MKDFLINSIDKWYNINDSDDLSDEENDEDELIELINDEDLPINNELNNEVNMANYANL